MTQYEPTRNPFRCGRRHRSGTEQPRHATDLRFPRPVRAKVDRRSPSLTVADLCIGTVVARTSADDGRPRWRVRRPIGCSNSSSPRAPAARSSRGTQHDPGRGWERGAGTTHRHGYLGQRPEPRPSTMPWNSTAASTERPSATDRAKLRWFRSPSQRGSSLPWAWRPRPSGRGCSDRGPVGPVGPVGPGKAPETAEGRPGRKRGNASRAGGHGGICQQGIRSPFPQVNTALRRGPVADAAPCGTTKRPRIRPGWSLRFRACPTGRVTDPAPDSAITRMAQHDVPPTWVKIKLSSAPIEAMRERGTKCAFGESSPPSSPRQPSPDSASQVPPPPPPHKVLHRTSPLLSAVRAAERPRSMRRATTARAVRTTGSRSTKAHKAPRSHAPRDAPAASVTGRVTGTVPTVGHARSVSARKHSTQTRAVSL